MILTRTPLRISLFGGGTDLPAFCDKHVGRVLTGAIDKYIYIGLKERFDNKTRVSYSTTELVDDVADIQHAIVRESFLKAKVSGVDVGSFSDVPPHGSGLGSSSAFTVGLLNAIYAMRGVSCSNRELAAEACKIEMVKCKKPIGRQDQYAAALGGLRELVFQPGDDQVTVRDVPGGLETAKLLQDRLLLFYTGVERNGDKILAEQSDNIRNDQKITASLSSMANITIRAKEYLEKGQIYKIGSLMAESWFIKKTLSSGVTTPELDLWYATAIAAGAQGGKCSGAGGGGFMVFFAEPANHANVIASLPKLRHIPFQWDYEGTKVVYSHGAD